MNNLDKTTKSTASQQKGLSMDQEQSGNLFWKFISLLANFPAPNYLKEFGNWSDKLTVVISAIVVIISPVVSTYILISHAPIILGEGYSNIYFFLPLTVFIIDLKIMGNCWQAKGDAIWSLVVGRVLLAVISLLFAIGAALAYEKENLQKSLQEHEVEAALKDPEIKARYDFFSQQIVNYQETILENERRHQERESLAHELTSYKRLAWLEENGHTGIDEKTGVYVKGGKSCGTNCKTYLRDAKSVKTRIEELDALPVINEALQQKIHVATKDQQLLLRSKLSDPNSLGSLIEGVFHTDFGVLFNIFLKLIAILTLELAAILVAFITASKNLLDVAKYQSEDDKINLSYVSKSKKAEIYAKHAASRAKISSKFSPIIVQGLSQKKSEKAKHYQEENDDQIKEQGAKVA